MTKEQQRNFKQLFQASNTYCLEYLGSLTDSKSAAEGFFIEAISRYWLYQQQGKIKRQSHPNAFIAAMSKRIWLKKTEQFLDADTGQKPIDEPIDLYDLRTFEAVFDEEIKIEQTTHSFQKKQSFQQAFAQLGEKCQQLLKGRFVYKVSHQKLAMQLKLKQPKAVTSSITRCQKRLMDNIIMVGTK